MTSGAMVYDHIVVGAGAAGCVLANRLSARPELQVLLIEAGMDLPPGREPAAIRDPFPASYGDPRYAWPGLVAEVGARPPAGQPRYARPYVQGRVMGGSSSIMGMMAQRGLPADFDEWEQLGATGWGWAGVLPFFNRLEHDLDFAGPLHGQSGPIPIRRTPRAQWGPFCRAFAEVAEARGHPWLPDLNAQFGDGLSAVPMNNLPTHRVSAASGYLDAAVRQRPNLHILTDACVHRLLLQQQRVVGVEALAAGGLRCFSGRQVTLSAGALHSPALLLRSGIGPEAHLRGLGVAPVQALPGVGANLANHPTIHLAVHLPMRARQAPALRTWAQAVLRYSSGLAGCAAGDMLLFPTNKTSWHPLGLRVGALGVCVYKSYSRGDVRLASPSPAVAPQVRFNLLDDARDQARMLSGLQLAFEMLATPAMAAVRNEVFLPPGGQANDLNQPGLANWLKASAINALFTVSGSVRRRALGNRVLDPAALCRDARALQHIVQQAAAPVHHVCGTAKMGPAADPMAVVDPQCRVHGVAGLRVVDASIMPSIVSANTHLTVLMLAEKAAELMLLEPDGRP